MSPFPPDIAKVFDAALAEDPDRAAVTTSAGTVNYGQLDELANRCARNLRRLGVGPGDRVGACLPNGIEIIIAFHAVMRLGGIWVGVNGALAAPEKEYMLRDSGASLLLCDADTTKEIQPRRGSLADLREIVSLGEGEGLDAWRAALEAESVDPLGTALDPRAPAAIAYTSGTTGHPKGVVHSQYNLLVPGAHLIATRRYERDLRKGDCFPLTIINMLVLTTLLTAQARGLAVIMDSLRAADVAEWIRRERVTVWNGPPPVLYTMAQDDRIPASHLSTMQEVWSGGADCPETIRSAFESKFGVEIRGTFGQTEVPTVVTIEVPGAPHGSGSSGMPLPHLEVSIRDADDRVLPSGEVGEICVGARAGDAVGRRLSEDWEVAPGPSTLPTWRPMLEYWNKPEATEATLRDGRLHTGDAGFLNPDGTLVVSDRLNLVLNRGGANVYPAEVERVAVAFSAVDSCGVLGLPDERLGQRVGMLVQFKTGEKPDLDGLLEHCRAGLAAYKVPEFAAAVDDLPRNAMGKIDRGRLNEVGGRLLVATGRLVPGAAAT